MAFRKTITTQRQTNLRSAAHRDNS